MSKKDDIDQRLLSEIGKGDHRAFEELYNRYFSSVFRLAFNLLNNRQAAEDIASETFIRLWKKRSDIARIENLSAFLYTSTRNACLNHIRNDRRHSEHHERIKAESETGTVAPIDPVSETVLNFLETELKKLPPRQLQVLKLHLSGYSNNEIAVAINISEKTVRNLKSDAIKNLKAVFRDRKIFALALVYLPFLN